MLIASSLILGVGHIGAFAQTWLKGDVFVGNVEVGNGFYDVYSNAGVYKGSLSDGHQSGGTVGCAFNENLSKLYTTDSYYSEVDVYDATGTDHRLLKTIDTSFAGGGNSSIVFNQAGDYYVSNETTVQTAPPVGIAEFNAEDNYLTTYTPPYTALHNSTGFVDLSSDQKTLFYTNGGNVIKRYDVSSRMPLPDFGTVMDAAGGIRLLPPFDGSGGLLVADSSALLRLDQHGQTVQTYTAATGYPYLGWTDVALDPNGRSFWATEGLSSTLFRFNIASGVVEVNGGHPPQGGLMTGICVRGGTEGPDATPPVVTLAETLPGPPKQVLLESYDGQSGLQSVVVNHCNNCTAATDGFTAGTNNIVTTTGTKTDQTKSSSIEITATDVAGNQTTFDPVDLTLEIEWYPAVHTIRILPSEHLLVISNGMPGMSKIELIVNGQVLPEVKLRDREIRRIDLSEYMRKTEKNDVRMQADGKNHATAWLIFTEP